MTTTINFKLSNLKPQNKWWMLSFLLLLLVASGCAKAVTPTPGTGTQLSLTVTFGGDVTQFSTNRYYLVMNSQAGTPAIPPPGGTLIFKDPTETFTADYPRNLYDYYFDTWTDFINFVLGSFQLYRSPFTTGQSPNYTWLRNPTDLKKMTIEFDLTRLSTFPNTRLYFDVVAIDPYNHVDHLKSAESIANEVGTTASGSDEADPSLDPSIDILSWQALIK